jgi:hypothetical protein
VGGKFFKSYIEGGEMNEEINQAIEATNKSILHWYHDIYLQLLMGRAIRKHSWDNGELVSMYDDDCPLCALTGCRCDDCPLYFILECCDDYGSSWDIFYRHPTAENAMNMILALVKARENLEE